MNWLARLYIWATYRLYNEFAWAYDLAACLVSLGRWSRWRRKALDHLAGERVLEIGFGTGELLVEMAKGGLRAVGLDESPAMHRVAAHRLARHNATVPRVRGVTQAMPLASETFDTIVSTFPAGYILHPATLQEAARLLRPPDPVAGTPGGRLVVVGMTVHFEKRILQRGINLLLGAPQASAQQHFQGLAQAAGLQVTVLDQAGQWVNVPVIIAEKQ